MESTIVGGGIIAIIGGGTIVAIIITIITSDGLQRIASRFKQHMSRRMIV